MAVNMCRELATSTQQDVFIFFLFFLVTERESEREREQERERDQESMSSKYLNVLHQPSSLPRSNCVEEQDRE